MMGAGGQKRELERCSCISTDKHMQYRRRVVGTRGMNETDLSRNTEKRKLLKQKRDKRHSKFIKRYIRQRKVRIWDYTNEK